VYCDTCQIYMTALYETLIGVDPTDLNTLIPRLAQSWEANDDNTEFTFMLDPDATFADGAPVTSADVKFSWDRLAGLVGSASYLMAGATVEAPDEQTFSCLRLARQAGMQGGTAPCVLNAADEVAVAAFLAGELAFTGIAEVVERTLDAVPSRPVGHFSDLYEADASARRRAAEICEGARA